MRVSTFLFVTVLLSLGAQAALAAGANGTDNKATVPGPVYYSTPSATANNEDKITCHPYVHEGMVTSIVGCMTEREWKNSRLDTQRAISDLQRRSFSAPY